jgi:DNA-binding LytR/AlgR family response regulator
MIKIALCDDEKKFLKLEMKYIEEYFTEKGMPYCVECFSSGEKLLEDKVQIETADLIILDVEMKGIDGISVAKSIRQQNDKVNIAFLSAHMNYSTDGYHVRAVRFILKTLDDLKDYLFECLDCVMTNMDLFDKEITMDFSIGKRTLKIKDIVYLKTSGNYTAFVLSNDSKENLIMRNTLKRLTETMKPFDFIAVSSNETVNLRHITDVTRYLVTLDNGEQIQASQKKYNDVFRAYTLYRGRNA